MKKQELSDFIIRICKKRGGEGGSF